jgi:drug/metabolite transporter (DMT)-like permease
MSTMIMGVVLLGEPFTAWLVAGTLLVIAGVFVCSRARA